MSKKNMLRLAALTAAAALALTACGDDAADPGTGDGGEGTLRIGTKYDQPGLGLDEGGEAAEPAPATSGTDELWRRQVSDGLQSLGWSSRDAEAAGDNVAHLVEEDPDIPIGKLLRAALNSLARR